jgi:hypothetical protein
MMDQSKRPRISVGIIVLNGEPFTRYCLRSIYPFAHQIIVVEGGSKHAAKWCTEDGHSIDGTLEVLRRFKEEEDSENKLEIVTNEGFWAEKDEQSRAYADRATGDWLWQIDIDEFYRPDAVERLLSYLQSNSDVTSMNFPVLTFWGDICYEACVLSEKASGFRRLFRFGPGYEYISHRPPVVVDASGSDLTVQNPISAREMEAEGVFLYHYSLVFPQQVTQKTGYYRSLAEGRATESHVDRGAPSKMKSASEWAERCYFDLQRPFQIHLVHWHPSWLQHFVGSHPPEAVAMMDDLRSGEVSIEGRDNADVDALLAEGSFRLKRELWRLSIGLYPRLLEAVRNRPWWLRRDLYWRLTGKR